MLASVRWLPPRRVLRSERGSQAAATPAVSGSVREAGHAHRHAEAQLLAVEHRRSACAHWRRSPSMRECAVARPTPDSSTAKRRSSSRHDASIARVLPRSRRPMASRMRASAAAPSSSACAAEADRSRSSTSANSRCSRVDRSTSRRSWSSKCGRVYSPVAQSRKPWSAGSRRSSSLARCCCSSCSSAVCSWLSFWRCAPWSVQSYRRGVRPPRGPGAQTPNSRRVPAHSRRCSLLRPWRLASAVCSAARHAGPAATRSGRRRQSDHFRRRTPQTARHRGIDVASRPVTTSLIASIAVRRDIQASNSPACTGRVHPVRGGATGFLRRRRAGIGERGGTSSFGRAGPPETGNCDLGRAAAHIKRTARAGHAPLI